MFEQDYVMRLIKEMVRAILKLLFNIDTDSPSAELLEDAKEQQTLDELLDMVDNGFINEAENKIYECIFRKNCASVPEERSAIPLQTEQSSAG